VQEYVPGKPNTLRKKKIITTKYMKQETACQNIKNQLMSSTENKKVEELKSKQVNGRFYWDLERPSVDKENPWLRLK
jgi:hypothetical protein